MSGSKSFRILLLAIKQMYFPPIETNVDEIIKEFLIESNENLDRLDRALVQLEQQPDDHELLADIFRTIHSIKGTSGCLGFHRLEAVAHAGENLLSQLRDGLLSLSPQIVSGLLSAVDAIRAMLALVDTSGADGSNDHAQLIASISSLQHHTTHVHHIAPPASASVAASIAPAAVTPPVETTAAKSAPAKKAKLRKRKLPKPQSIEAPAVASTITATEQIASEQVNTAQPQVVMERRRGTDRREGGDRREPMGADSAIRVNVTLLERLMDLVGELVLTRNQIIQYAAGQRDSTFVAVSQRLNLVTSDMREIIMKTRMQPIQNVMGQFPRLVRDIAIACQKQVRIEVIGQETELDRTILEAIKDPLTHTVRNAVDHGIEQPEARIAAGKPAEGCVTLRAFHEGGQINIEVADDGAGLNAARIKAKAIDKGLISQAQADAMGPAEIVNLIFKPGFSTAEKVTNVSGRGVGMDVVKTNIEKLGGTVDVQTTPGVGTTLRMKIPLTLAIIPVLIVRSAGTRFAIPQVNLIELLRLEGERAKAAIEMVHGAPVYRLRGNLLPLIFLRRELRQDANEGSTTVKYRSMSMDRINIVVLQAENQQFGVVVDEIHDAEEIVVKPLGQHLKQISAFAGATVLGDGEVALILDVTGLAQGGGLLNEPKKAAIAQTAAATADTQQNAADSQELLLLRIAGGRRAAVPLKNVDRLEEFSASRFEHAGRGLVTQYRGELLPMVSLSEQFNTAGGAQNPVSEEPLQVLVCNHQGARLGVIVDQIIDVADEAVEIDSRWKDAHLIGSGVVQKKVTDFLDLGALLQAASQGLSAELSQAMETIA